MDVELILFQLRSLLGLIVNVFLNTTADFLNVVGLLASSSETMMADLLGCLGIMTSSSGIGVYVACRF
jgi:hypothetical protein